VPTRVLCALVCFLAFCGVAAAQQGASQKIWVGVLPVADASGEAQSELFGQNLTGMIFRELQSSPVEPMLLNPGGLYNPLSTEWIVEYGHRIGVDLVVISTILPSDKPKKGDWTLKVQSQLMDLTSGKMSALFLGSVQIDRRHVIADPRNGGVGIDSPADYLHQAGTPSSQMILDDRPYEKQPLGKAAKTIAESLSTQIASMAPTISSLQSAPAPIAKSGPCESGFGVSYGKKISTAYDFIVNGRNESLGMIDGRAKFSTSSGTVVVRVVVHDAPYRLPVQRLYQASTYLDCGLASRSQMLSMEIGATGEAQLVWK